MTTRLEQELERIIDVRQLMQKKGVRKGALTCLKAYYDTTNTKALEEFKLSDIIRCQEDMSKAIIIQETIDSLATDDVIEAEAMEVEEQRRYNSELEDYYSDLCSLTSAWDLGMGIEEAANELLGRESILSAYNKPQFEKLVEEYDKFKEAVRANSGRELVDLG